MADAKEQQSGRQRRQLRNLLLDRRFQLKYAGYMVAVAALLSVTLGGILWQTSNSLIGQSKKAVEQGQQIVTLGQQVAKESQKVNEVVKMNIVQDPVYGDSPELLEAFKSQTKEQDSVQAKQQAALQEQATALSQQSDALAAKQQTMLTTLLVLLALLVGGVGMIGIVVTHKVAGPVYKMKRQLRAVGEGRWQDLDPLRKGDELGSFFATFEQMVRDLRSQREKELSLLDEAIEQADGDAEQVKSLQALRAEMNRMLETG